MFDVKAKFAALSARIKGNSYVRLTLGENRKNNLRKSRRTCLIVFTVAAAVMIMVYMSISGAASALSANSPRAIDVAALSNTLTEVRAEIAEMESTDTSEYGGKELVDHNNRLENLKRSEQVLTTVQSVNFDGKKYTVSYYINGAWTTMGTHSYSYDALFTSYVLDFIIMLIAIFISITVANVFGAEYSEKTAKLMFIKPSSRVKLFLSKINVVVKELLLYVVIAFLLLLFIAWANSGLDLKPLVTYIGNGVRVVGVAEQLALCFISLLWPSLFYMTLATLFSIAAKSRVLPIFAVILFSRLPALQAIENLMQNVAASSTAAYNLFFSNHVNLYQYIAHSQLSVSGTNFTASFFILGAYIVVLFVGALFSFKKQSVMK